MKCKKMKRSRNKAERLLFDAREEISNYFRELGDSS